MKVTMRDSADSALQLLCSDCMYLLSHVKPCGVIIVSTRDQVRISINYKVGAQDEILFLLSIESWCKGTANSLLRVVLNASIFNEHTVWYAKSIQIVLLLLLDFGDFVGLLELGPASWLSSSFFTASW